MLFRAKLPIVRIKDYVTVGKYLKGQENAFIV